MDSYDLTEDNRGLSLDGRIINTELVIVRNKLFAIASKNKTWGDVIDNHETIKLYNLVEDLLKK